MELEAQLKLLPDRPGVYIYKNAAGQILYVGKAVNLKHRVRSYFQSSRNLTGKVLSMVGQIVDIEHIVTDNEVEALILESNLIKRHKPKYNIRLRDDKHYPYLRLTTNHPWPRLEIARAMRKDGSRYFGPYTTSQAVYDTLKLIRPLFPLRSCKDPSKYPTACLELHIGRCLGPCLAGFDKQAEYEQAVKDTAAFLEGRVEDVTRRLKAQMESAADNLEFERAAELRDRLRAVEKVAERQKIITGPQIDQDVIAFARERDEAVVQVFFVRQGKLVGRDQFTMTGADELTGGEIFSAFIEQHYTSTDFIPREILVAEEPPERDVLEAWLGQRRGAAVSVLRPQRGSKRQLVEMVAKNAEEGLAERKNRREKEIEQTEGAVDELGEHLGFGKRPWRIECFDISHVQGSEVVASMVVFEGGVARKEDYRKFKMKLDQNNDFANMAEAVTRRFKRGLAERQLISEGRVRELEAAEEPVEYAEAVKGAKFATFPDLVIIDGGVGQLNAARAVMRELGVDHIPTVGLAKKEELIIREGEPEPLVLPRGSQALYLVQRVRDEAHRFAITYHRQLHRKAATVSRLDDVPGIGPKRKKELLKNFGSLKRIREASVEELAAVPGMNREAAERVLEVLGGRLEV